MSLLDPNPMPPQAQNQPSFGQRFMQNLGPILQGAGIGLASGNMGAGAAAMPALADRRRHQLMQQQQMAQQQQSQNATITYFRQKDPEIAHMLEQGVIDGQGALQLYTQKQKQAAESSGRDYIAAGGGRIFDTRARQWVAPPQMQEASSSFDGELAAEPTVPQAPAPAAGLAAPGAKVPSDKAKRVGLTTAQENDLAKADASVQTLSKELDEYAKMVGKQGNAYLPGKERDAVSAKRYNILLQMKELYNLGVLNGPDLDIMNEMLLNAAPSAMEMPGAVISSVGGMFDEGMSPEGRAKANAAQLKNQFQRIVDEKRASLGLQPGTQTTAPQQQDSAPDFSNMSDDELRAIINGQ